MGIGVKPQPAPAAASTMLAPPSAPAHGAVAAAIAKGLGNTTRADLPAIAADATPATLAALIGPALAATGEVLTADVATWLLQLAAHPRADQSVHDEIAIWLSVSSPLAAEVASSGFAPFLRGLASLGLQQTLPEPPTAATKKTIGTEQPRTGALHVGPGPTRSGNALSSRLALMTGAQTVKSTTAAIAAFQAARAEGRVPTSLPMTALDKLDIDKAGGVVVRLGGCKVAGQRVAIRKIEHPVHGPGLELHLKLRTSKTICAVDDTIAAAGGTLGEMRREPMTVDARGANVIRPGAPAFTVNVDGKGVPSRTLERAGAWSVEVVGDADAFQAARGATRVRIFGEGPALNARFAEVVASAGLGEVFADATPTMQARANQLRVLWQHAPKQAGEFAQIDIEHLAQKHLDAAFASAGIDPSVAAALPSREVFPGHVTTVDPAQADRYRALGVQYLFAGVRSADALVKVLAGDGMMSTMERYERGIIVEGSSSAADVASGGADYVFTRMVTSQAKGVPMEKAFGAGRYQIQIDPQVLERTDWFAYTDDALGETTSPAFTARKYGADLIDALATTRADGSTSFAASNEVMFQRGIAKESFTGILAESEQAKQELIPLLVAAGVTTIGGKALDDAIRVQTTMLE